MQSEPGSAVDGPTAIGQGLATFQAIALTLTGSLPVFLTGALAVHVTGELGIGPGGLGLAASLLFATSGVVARPMGALIQARGIRFGYGVAATTGSVSLLTIATAQHYAVLLVAMVLGGVANAMGQPTANMLLTQSVAPRRLGLAMGIKQSYIPVASLLGGLSVPTIAAEFGWRWAMAVAAALCLVIAATGVVSRRAPAVARAAPVGAGRRRLPRRAMLILTVGTGVSAGAATSLGVFLVDSAVDSGVSPAQAGYLLAACSGLSLATRVTLGWAVDRLSGRNLYALVANLLTVTVVGFLLLALGSPAFIVVGALAAYLGWSWTGILHLAIVRDNDGAVATATGYLQTGLALGAALGPISLGVIAESTSYEVAWLATAVIGLAGMVVVRTAERMIRRGVSEDTRPRGRSGAAAR
ncbi:MFS transporter [Nocardioides jensenii]|uniref:MFS transporter n=1 Tax=Nocardioides jensenii TaxID=1843 RepID=UPI00082EBD10|nr:MFS transporter [Nocardioides jensenii]